LYCYPAQNQANPMHYNLKQAHRNRSNPRHAEL
jgi:hypothetical protein